LALHALVDVRERFVRDERHHFAGIGEVDERREERRAPNERGAHARQVREAARQQRSADAVADRVDVLGPGDVRRDARGRERPEPQVSAQPSSASEASGFRQETTKTLRPASVAYFTKLFAGCKSK